MALASTIVWEVRGGGDDTNGGGFKAGATGTDWSVHDAPQYSVTDAVTNNSTTVTSPTASFGPDVVGNVCYLSGSGTTTGWYEITARTSSTTITVDRATGGTGGSGVTLRIGGAFATPGRAASTAVSGNKVWVRYHATDYAVTTSTPGPSGPVLPGAVTFVMEGYETTRGDRGNKPTLKWTAPAPGATTYVFSGNGNARQVFINLIADANSVANVGGFGLLNQRYFAIDCEARNASATGQYGFRGAQNPIERCFADNCYRGFASFQVISGCVARSCPIGFPTGIYPAVDCIAISCGEGFNSVASIGAYLRNCTADSCSSAGFVTTGANTLLMGCLATNSLKGFDVGTDTAYMYQCAMHNNATAITVVPAINSGPIVLTADPYVDRAGGDYRPNNTAGGGAALRAAGIGIFGQVNHRDAGAGQHADPAGGGGRIPHLRTLGA